MPEEEPKPSVQGDRGLGSEQSSGWRPEDFGRVAPYAMPTPNPDAQRQAGPYAGPGGQSFPPPPSYALPPVYGAPPVNKEPAGAPGALPLGLSLMGGSPAPERTSGMIAAGVILCVNGGITILLYLVLAAIGRTSPVVIVAGGAAVVDIVLAIGLFRGNRTFRIWALLRAVGCAVIFGVVFPISNPSSGSWTFAIFPVGLAIALVILVFGEHSSTLRVVAGVTIVLLSFVSMVGIVIFKAVKSLGLPGTAYSRYALMERRFTDERSGVVLDLPVGWVLLSRDNPVLPASRAQAVVYHARSGSFAAIIIEPKITPSLDSYVDNVVKARQRRAPDLVEERRETITFAGQEGRRLYTHWSTGVSAIRGYTDICGDAFDRYQLSGWCASFMYASAYREFEELAKGFRLTKSTEDKLADRTAILSREMPYLSESGTKDLALYLARTGVPFSDEAGGGLRTMDGFVQLLPPGSARQFELVMQQALSSLRGDQAKRVKADADDMRKGSATQDGIDDYSGLVWRAFDNLPPNKKSQTTDLADKAISLGIAQNPPPEESESTEDQ